MQCLQKTIFSCAQLLCTYEEEIKIQTTEMKKHTKILKTNFLRCINYEFFKITFSHKHNALSLKEQSWLLDVQEHAMYLDRSF